MMHIRDIIKMIEHVTLLILLLCNISNAQEEATPDPSNILQQIQGAMDKLANIESSMGSGQERMVKQLGSLFGSFNSGLVKKFTGGLETFQAEIHRIFNQDKSDTGINAVESGLWTLNHEMVKFRRFMAKALEIPGSCEDGWMNYGDSCYYISQTLANWTMGRKKCLAMDSDYVKITSDEEFEFLAGQISFHTWIGLNDMKKEGVFSWSVDGTNDTSSSRWWVEDQPDNAEGGEDCVHYWLYKSSPSWNDMPCNIELKFICEKASTSSSHSFSVGDE